MTRRRPRAAAGGDGNVAETGPRRTTRSRRAAASTASRARAGAGATRGSAEEPRRPGGATDAAEHGEVGAVCPVAFCPICTAVSVVNRASPDVVQHLLVAGQQFLLALQAVVDARAADYRDRQEADREAPGMQRIDIG